VSIPLLLTAAVALAATDQVFTKGSSKPVLGTVVSEDYKEVQIRRGSAKTVTPLKSSRIERVVYDDAPEAYLQGVEYLESGDAENALASFQVAMDAQTRGDWVKVHAAYRAGLAHQMLGASNPPSYHAAADQFEKLVTDHPETRFLPDALLRWGESLAAAGDTAGASTVFDRLASEAEAKKLGLAWEARARLAKADALAEAGDPGAQAAYQEAAGFAQANASHQEDPEVVDLLETLAGKARVAEGQALLSAKQYDQARRFFQGILQSSDSTPTAAAGALCGLGEVLLGEDKPAEALEQLAQARVQYFLIRDQAARATYLMGQCCLALGDAEPNGKAKARAYFTEVAERFSDTSWAEQAQAQLQ